MISVLVIKRKVVGQVAQRNEPDEHQELLSDTLQDKQRSEIIDHILSAIEDMEYGTVQITVHDSQVTQIERLEKKRFPVTSREKFNEHGKSNRRHRDVRKP